ncbi:Uncharacterised protein [uncultured archaeon]|nr:Uncharacterised protein [uncultured archaeon]
MIRLVVPPTKRPATVSELSDLVKSHKNEDVVSRLGDLKLEQDKLLVKSMSSSAGLAVRESGMRDLLSHLGMPYHYANAIPNDLLYDSVNRLLHTYGDFEVMVRSQDGEVRGILSPSYVKLDSSDLTSRLRKAAEVGLIPARILYDGDSLTASFVSDQKVTAVDKGDITQIGVALSTSDIDRFQLSAEAYLYRLVCTNGAVLPVSMGGGVSFSQKKVNPDTVWDIFDKGYQRILERMSQTDSEFLIRLQNKKVDANGWIRTKDKLSKFASGRRMAEVLKNMELEAKERGTDFNFYDIYNAITQTARDEASLYTAQNLEKAAGDLLYSFGTDRN